MATSSGNCNAGSSLTTYDTSNTDLPSSNDFDGDSDNPCGYTVI